MSNAGNSFPNSNKSDDDYLLLTTAFSMFLVNKYVISKWKDYYLERNKDF